MLILRSLFAASLATQFLTRTALSPRRAAVLRMASGVPEVQSMTVAQLKEQLRARGLPVSGTKPTLVARLLPEVQGVSPKLRATRAAPKPRATKAARSGVELAPSGKTVVVVESPAKCATISKFLGPNFVVLACYGHVRALPSKPGSVRPEEGFAMSFEDCVQARTLNALRNALRDRRGVEASRLLLATDPDREGEAIAWHVLELLQGQGALPPACTVQRIAFSEISKAAVSGALAAPRDINMPLVRAQQARQAVDYLVGFTLSPVLWRKLPGCRSAGRVQSVALRLVVEREEEIVSFVPQEHWSLALTLGDPKEAQPAPAGADAPPGAAGLAATVKALRGSKLDTKGTYSITSTEQAEAAVAALREQLLWTVSAVKRRKKQLGPPAPFNTASLQMDASRRLSLPVGIVMRMAQTLYEGVELGGGERRGLITYMRTDGTQMSADAVGALRKFIGATYGKGADVLPPSARQYKRKSANAQEAHEAIRPVDFSVTPQQLAQLAPALGDKERALYELVWRRAVASQMANSVYDQLSIELVSAEDDAAVASASVLATAGFRLLYQPDDAGDGGGGSGSGGSGGGGAGQELPEALCRLHEGDELALRRVDPTQKFTEAPPRFSEGSLVKKLEVLGVGRPSTYSGIMRVLQERSYVEMRGKALRPLERGQLLSTMLVTHLEQFVEAEFTARLEEQLDQISAGDLDANRFLDGWWRTFEPAVGTVAAIDTQELRNQVADKLAARLFPAVTPRPADGAVAVAHDDDNEPKHHSGVVAASHGGGHGSGHGGGSSATATAAAAAVATLPAVAATHAAAGTATATATAAVAEAAGSASVVSRPCPSCCDGTMQLKFSRYGPFIGCSHYPNCSWTRQLTSEGGDDQPKARVLGTQPESLLEVSLRQGPYGHYLQLGGNLSREETGAGAGAGSAPLPEVAKLRVTELREQLEARGLETTGRKAELAARLQAAPDLRHLVPQKRVSLPPGTARENVTLPMALRLLELPLQLGKMAEGAHRGANVTLAVGRFGPFVAMTPVAATNGKADGEAAEPPAAVLASLPKDASIYNFSLDEARVLLERKIQRSAGRGRGRGRGRGQAAGRGAKKVTAKAR